MAHSGSADHTADIATNALGRMRELGIPATPDNFEVWYTYCAGTNDELARALDSLSSEPSGLTAEHSTAVHQRFFTAERGTGTESASLRETSMRIEAAVKVALEMLSQAGDKASRYGDALVEFSGEISDAKAAGQVRQVIAGLLEETRRMENATRRIESQLSASHREVSELRQSLEDVRREARHDSLTGLCNRKTFDAEIGEMIASVGGAGGEISLLMLDIDHFKQFNDNYGHQLGDEVLKLVARSLMSCVKGRDITARYGGEEFAIVLARTGIDDAREVAEQVRITVARKQIIKKSTGEALGNITLSIGAAVYRPGETVSELIRRADEALYAAKRRGRNRVVTVSNQPRRP